MYFACLFHPHHRLIVARKPLFLPHYSSFVGHNTTSHQEVKLVHIQLIPIQLVSTLVYYTSLNQAL